ncbi:MAG: hypothetical protein ACJAWV_001850, partial [Flammeovirgaceae bacterium]
QLNLLIVQFCSQSVIGLMRLHLVESTFTTVVNIGLTLEKFKNEFQQPYSTLLKAINCLCGTLRRRIILVT